MKLKSLLAISVLVMAPLAMPSFAATAAECAKQTVDQRITGALAMADRPADQRERDAARKAEVTFLLSHVKPGDRVLDIGAGQGYATWLLSSAVCDGHVDSQNPQGWVDYYKMGPARDAMVAARKNVSLLTVDFDKIPAPAKPYDVIFMGMVYHDTYNEKGHDTAKLTASLKSLLKPGGIVIITDHDTAPGKGFTETNTTHRIEKAQVLADFKAAGFEVSEDSAVLANAGDDHTKNVFDPAVRGKTDKMALVFRKP
jgi:predicted methyltransferase